MDNSSSSRATEKYAKRLLDRNKDPATSDERRQQQQSISKSSLRRAKIMDAIGKNQLSNSVQAAAAWPVESAKPRGEVDTSQGNPLVVDGKLAEFQQPKQAQSELYPNLSSMERRMLTEECANDDDDGEQSFFRRSASLLRFWGLRRRRRRGNKPELESTRRVATTAGQCTATCSISTLSVPNTPPSLEVQRFVQRLTLGDGLEGASESLATAGVRTADKSLTGSIKWRFRRRITGKHSSGEEPRIGSRELAPPRSLEHSAEAKRLLDLMDLYETHARQASKALELCESRREFRASPERLELERLLLVASLGRAATRECIRHRLGCSPTLGRDGEPELAELALLGPARLRLPPAATSPQPEDGRVEWLLLVASQGANVWASAPVARRAVTDPDCVALRMPGELVLPGLAPDFRLRLALFSLRLPVAEACSHEDKYRIRGDAETTSNCPSPRRLLAAASSRASPPRPRTSSSSPRRPGFRELAGLELGLADVAAGSLEGWPLMGLPGARLLAGLRCRLRLSTRCGHAGFVTHAGSGDEGRPVAWSRRWCALEAASLRFWNYPREQEDELPPLYAIELAGCATVSLTLAQRSTCPRPRTLLLETRSQRDSGARRLRNLLSCDTQQELLEWQSRLEHLLRALRDWKLIDREYDYDDEDQDDLETPPTSDL